MDFNRYDIMKQLLIFLISLMILISVSCVSRSGKKGEDEKKEQVKQSITYISPRNDTQFFSLLNLDFPGMEEVF